MTTVPTDLDMRDRVVRLEVQFDHIVKDLDEIKADQKALLADQKALMQQLGELKNAVIHEFARRPTVGQFWTMIATVSLLAFTTVGLIIGGLAALK